jgi:hypothetical protein
LNGLPPDQVLVNDAIQIFAGRMAIPMSAWIDERDGTFSANPQTAYLRSEHRPLNVHEALLTNAAFQMPPGGFALLERGALTRPYA